MKKYTVEEVLDLMKRNANGEEIDIGAIGYAIQQSEASEEFLDLIDKEIERRKKKKERDNENQ